MKNLQNWRSQFGTSNISDKMELRYAPMVFTEQACPERSRRSVAMLSSVLSSQTTIKVNIQIIRVFTKIRQMFTDNLSIKLEIEDIKKKLTSQNKNIELVFSYLDELLEKKENQI